MNFIYKFFGIFIICIFFFLKESNAIFTTQNGIFFSKDTISDSIRLNITSTEFYKICKKVKRKIKKPKDLSIEDWIICVRVFNSFPRNLGNMSKRREKMCLEVVRELDSYVMAFVYKLEAIPVGSKFYSPKYNIWIGTGVGVKNAETSYYQIIPKHH